MSELLLVGVLLVLVFVGGRVMFEVDQIARRFGAGEASPRHALG